MKQYPPIEDRPLVVLTPKLVMDAVINDDIVHPPFIVKVFCRLITERAQEEILAAAKNLFNLEDLAYPCTKRHESRSTTPALHVGIWQPQNNPVCVSQDSHKQTPAILAQLDTLLGLIKLHILPKLETLLEQTSPRLAERGQRCVIFKYLKVNINNVSGPRITWRDL